MWEGAEIKGKGEDGKAAWRRAKGGSEICIQNVLLS